MVFPGFCLCLPGGTIVTTKTGQKRIQELQPNDRVLTFNPRRGQQKWTTFYTWGHRQSDTYAEFLVFQVNTGKELVISSQHLVFVATDKKSIVAKKAGQLCVGDKLYHIGDNGMMEILPISEIRAETFLGIYAPFTMSGHFLANGFLVGCYANIANFDVAHAALAPLRAWYKIRENSTIFGNKEGIHGYAISLMKLRDLLPLKINKLVT